MEDDSPLITPDALLPSQFADLHRSSNGPDAPIKRLMREMRVKHRGQKRRASPGPWDGTHILSLALERPIRVNNTEPRVRQASIAIRH